MKRARQCLFFVLALGCGQAEEKKESARLAIDYSREARDELQNGLFVHFPDGLDDHDILGWRREDLLQTEEYALLPFTAPVNRDTAIDLTREAGYRPANFDELLAYARENRQNFGPSPVFAVATIWKNRTFYAYLPYVYRSSGGLGLGFCAWDKMPSDAQFLSIKIQKD